MEVLERSVREAREAERLPGLANDRRPLLCMAGDVGENQETQLFIKPQGQRQNEKGEIKTRPKSRQSQKRSRGKYEGRKSQNDSKSWIVVPHPERHWVSLLP